MEVELKSPEGDKWSVYLITRDSSQQAIVRYVKFTCFYSIMS